MKKVSICLAVIIGLLFCSCKESKTENKPYDAMEYTILFGDKEAGYQKSWKNEDGSYGYEYEFNDRGRGPHIEERIELNENGVITSLDINGHNYYKDTVHENFKVTDGVAQWKSTSEEGQADFKGEKLFSAINSSFGATDIWLPKLFNAEDKEIELLPAGTIRLASLENHTIDSLNLRLVEYTGQSFTPGYVWIDKDDRFFAYTSSWVSCIRNGYDNYAKKLYAIQEKKEKAYFDQLATSLIESPNGKTLVKNATLFKSEDGTLQAGTNILIEGHTILEVTTDEISENVARTIEADGKMVLPGLFDMHTHIDRTDGIMHLAGGITSVRDLANSDELPKLANSFNSNELIGPRIVIMCGFIDQAGPYAGPTGAIVNSLEEGFDAVRDYKEKGYQQIKLYSSIDPEWVRPMANLAHELGMRVSGHIPAYMLAEQAVKDGYDEIQHTNMIALNFLPDTIDTRTPLRFSMIAKHTHALDFDSQKFKDFMMLLKEKETVVDPTVSIFEGMMTTKAGEPDPSFEAILHRLPLSIQRGFYSGGLPMEEGMEETHSASFEKLLGIVKQLHDHDITIVPGTDDMAGFGLHRELENYVRAGISPTEVLQLATLVSAEVCGIKEQAGSIKVGKWADLILVEGDPTKNISDIRNVVLTIKDGKIYDPQKLYGAIGVEHFK